jgi:hypothetical protein
MKGRETILAAAVMLLAAGCAAGGAGGRGDSAAAAAHVWPAGVTVAYSITDAESQEVEIPGAGGQVTNMSSTIDFSVAAAGERRFTVTVTEAVASNDAEAMGAETPDITALVGLESVVTLDERGVIVEASNLAGNSYIEDAGGVEMFREQLQGLFLILPEGGLGVGVTWDHESAISVTQMDGTMFEITSLTHYTCGAETVYEGVPAFELGVVVESALSGSGETGGMPMDLILSGTGTGTLWVTRGSAMILGARSEGILQGGVSVAGMDLPITTHSTSTLVKK